MADAHRDPPGCGVPGHAVLPPRADESNHRSLGSAARPGNVQAILDRSCNDCHTNETRWPWYTNVAPLSWSIIDHVNEGRDELSFSEWGTYSPKKADHKLEEICEMVERREMPLPEYLWLHRDAPLSDTDRKVLCNWVVEERTKIGFREDRGRGRGRGR